MLHLEVERGVVGTSIVHDGGGGNVVGRLVIACCGIHCRAGDGGVETSRVGNILPVEGSGRPFVRPFVRCIVVNKFTGKCRAIGAVTGKEIEFVAVYQVTTVIIKA